FHCSPTHPHPPSFPTRRSSDLPPALRRVGARGTQLGAWHDLDEVDELRGLGGLSIPGRGSRGLGPPPGARRGGRRPAPAGRGARDRKSTRLNSSHVKISYAVFC